MSTAERIAMGIVTVALVTTLVLNDRNTAQVIQAIGGGFTTALKTAMGR